MLRSVPSPMQIGEKEHLTRKHITKTESVKREEAQENREGHGMSVVSTQQGGEPA